MRGQALRERRGAFLRRRGRQRGCFVPHRRERRGFGRGLRLRNLRRGDRTGLRIGERIGVHALALGIVVVTARIERDGAIMIAARDLVGAGKITHRVSHVGVGIEQALHAAAVAERARGAEADLHHPVVALGDRARIVLALAHDHAMHQRHRQAVRGRMLGDQRRIGTVHAMQRRVGDRRSRRLVAVGIERRVMTVRARGERRRDPCGFCERGFAFHRQGLHRDLARIDVLSRLRRSGSSREHERGTCGGKWHEARKSHESQSVVVVGYPAHTGGIRHRCGERHPARESAACAQRMARRAETRSGRENSDFSSNCGGSRDPKAPVPAATLMRK